MKKNIYNSLLFRAYYSTAYTGNLMMNKDGRLMLYMIFIIYLEK